MRLLPLLSLIFLVPPVAAQSPAQRDSLEQWRDSLSTVADSAGLAALEQTMIDRARVDRDNTMLHLKLGFLALRMAELGSRSRYEDAGSEFEWAIDLAPRWPYPWYGLGLVEAGRADTTYGFLSRVGAVFHADPMTQAARAVRQSTTLDSAFAPGLTSLVWIVSHQLLNAKPEEALTIVRRAARSEAGQDPAFLLAWGNMERDFGYADSAAVAYQRYLDCGGDSATGLFQLARVRLAMGDLTAQELYYASAARGDSAVIEGIRRDLALLAGDSGLARFDSAGDGGRVDFLREFWDRRDRLELRKPGERLAEHYRRINYAHRHFRRIPRKRRILGFEDYRPVVLNFDARGEVYIRQGEPTERVEEPDYCAVSWRYKRPEGDLIFHFAGNPTVGDYNLKASVFNVCGPSALWLSPVLHWDPQYRKMVNAGSNAAARFRLDQELRGVRDIRTGVTGDRYALTWPRLLPTVFDPVTVGADADGNAVVHFPFAILADSLRPVPVPGGVEYPLRIRISILTTSGDLLATTDVRHSYRRADTIPAGQYLTGRETLHVPPGLHEYRLAVEQGDSAGGVSALRPIVVPATIGPRLAISDLVLGSRAIGPAWAVSRQDTVFFNPFAVFRKGARVELYYEVYGLTPGEEYTTTLSIRKQGKREAEVTLRFVEPGQEGVTRSRRTVGLERLGKGEYEMIVIVRGEDGGRVVQRRGFRVE